MAVAAQVPVLTILLFKTTPDILLGTEVAVYKLPPIPTPPVTTNAPEVVDVEVVLFVIDAVPPINAFPVTPRPPETTNTAFEEELALTVPSPTFVTPPNSLIVTVWPADAAIIGRPDMSLTENISPVDKLLSMENN